MEYARILLSLALTTSLLACASGSNGAGDGGTDGAPDAPASDMMGMPCTTDSECPDDGVFCNGPSVCTLGFCGNGMPPTCDDGVVCTEDACAPGADECQNVPNDDLCLDGTVCIADAGCQVPMVCETNADCVGDDGFCAGTDVCRDGVCRSTGMMRCDDGDSCTVDMCEDAASMCSNVAADNLTDPMHCGPTGADDCVPCPEPTAAQPNVVAVCDAGSCALECAPGSADGDGDLSNGCECTSSGSGDDEPDAAFMDTNCDGVDGDLGRAILVSTTMGNDTATCGLELDRACRTIGHAMTRAISESRRDLFVMAGTYDEVVTLRDGIRIFGGYDTTWTRGLRSDDDHRTELVGGAFMGHAVSVVAHGLVVAATLENLIVVGPTATVAGSSSYGVHAMDAAGLDIIRCTVLAGRGADGATGMAGADAATVDAPVGLNGDRGGDADGYVSTCDDFTVGMGGGAGFNLCGMLASDATTGGTGGNGGNMDARCVCIGFCICEDEDCLATPGVSGSNALDFMTGGFGYRGGGAPTCASGISGRAGRVRNGAAGTGASANRGRVVGGFWVGNSGFAGSTGENGGGGGGGGGSGGCDDGVIGGDNSHGAGGGGGGAGGCRAMGGGEGGGGGGGSFGIFEMNSTLNVTNSEIRRGVGGVGGAGGAGGRGQSGGTGGPGGAAGGTTGAGGAGGAGAHGGHGGGGGGGAGGPSVGVFQLGGTVDASSTMVEGGAAGAAGPGGQSAPTAPAPERDGNAGMPGIAGAATETFTCAAAGGC